MNVEIVTFALFAVIIVASAVGVIASQNTVRSAISLVVNFFTLGLLYFAMNYDLVGVSQILVYTGLIMMLFLFCILLLNLGAPQMLTETSYLRKSVAWLLGVALLVTVLLQVFAPLQGLSQTPTSPPDFGTAKSVGSVLFTSWVFAFEIASVLLLVGIVGSILLAKRRG